MTHPFLDDDSRVLTPDAFAFVLKNELKRALRSQSFLTLLVVEPIPHTISVDRAPLLPELAAVVSREVRETDLLSFGDDGRLSVVLLDADLQGAMRVIDRLMTRVAQYQFSTPLTIDVGAACCPTHGADVDALRGAADTHGGQRVGAKRGTASNGQ